MKDLEVLRYLVVDRTEWQDLVEMIVDITGEVEDSLTEAEFD